MLRRYVSLPLIWTMLLFVLGGCATKGSQGHRSERSTTDSSSAVCSLRGIAANYVANGTEEIDWGAALREGERVFKHIILQGDWNEFERIVDEFGEHDNVFDMLVLFSAQNFTSPGYWRFERWEIPGDLEVGISTEDYHDARLRSARILAKKFNEWDEHRRFRYYHAFVWSNDLRVSLIAGLTKVAEETAAGFDEAKGEEVWWYVRSALLLMYTTRELPEFDPLTPEAVRSAFVEWNERLMEDIRFLTPRDDGQYWTRGTVLDGGINAALRDTIVTPFPEWQGEPPSALMVMDHFDRSDF